jgi:ferric-dicitrate binding protein FerR (iron transport regulator)
MSNGDQSKYGDESGIERVLRAAGGRDQPSESLERHVRAAVHAEWRAAVAQRARARRQVGLAIAAVLALAVFGLWASRFWVETPRIVVASVGRAEGVVSTRESSWIAAWMSWRPLDGRQSLRSGEDLMTGPDGRAALAWTNGISLRLDRNTKIALVDAQHIEVRNGAVYVDSGTAAGSPQLRIDTPAGAVRHVGTQYEVRLLQSNVQIRVREGRVELRPPSGIAEHVDAGEQLTVAESGGHERTAIDTVGTEWAWVTDVAPPFAIEGRSLHEFLTWAGRELGEDIVFATPESEAEAAGATLHGSVAGLTPAEALQAVLPTTRLQSSQEDGRIVIQFQ